VTTHVLKDIHVCVVLLCLKLCKFYRLVDKLTLFQILIYMVGYICKAGFTLRRLDRRLDKRPASLVKVAKSL